MQSNSGLKLNNVYSTTEEITSTIQPTDRTQWFDQECSDTIEMKTPYK